MSHSPTRHDSLVPTGAAGVRVRASRLPHRRGPAAMEIPNAARAAR